MNNEHKATQAEQARKFAWAFRTEHPDLIRETFIELQEGENLAYAEVPVLDNGNVDLQRVLGKGGRMQVTTGNVLVYQHVNEDGSDWWDYTVILPNMSVGDVFTEEERTAGEMFALCGPLDGGLLE